MHLNSDPVIRIAGNNIFKGQVPMPLKVKDALILFMHATGCNALECKGLFLHLNNEEIM